MVKGEPEVQNDRSDGRVDEIIRSLAVCKIAHGRHAAFQLVGGRRNMEHFVIVIPDYDLLMLASKPPGCRGIIKRLVGHKPMQLEDKLPCQRLVLKLADALHREKVV